MAHTKGPWFPCCASKTEVGECHCGYIFDPGDKTVAKVDINDKRLPKYEPLEGEITIEEHNSNAFLIAAAPDLLEACKEFVRKCECGQARSVRSYAQMKAAIAKAEGK